MTYQFKLYILIRAFEAVKLILTAFFICFYKPAYKISILI